MKCNSSYLNDKYIIIKHSALTLFVARTIYFSIYIFEIGLVTLSKIASICVLISFVFFEYAYLESTENK